MRDTNILQSQGINPFNHNLNSTTKKIATISIALSIIAAVGGVLLSVAAGGTLGLAIGIPLTCVSGAALITALSWLIVQAKKSLNQTNYQAIDDEISPNEEIIDNEDVSLEETTFFNFPYVGRSPHNHFTPPNEQEFSDKYYNHIEDLGSFGNTNRTTDPSNQNTTVHVAGECYPANYISLYPELEEGQKGNTPYIIAAAPDRDHKDKELYYQMALDNNSSCLISLVPFNDEKSSFPDLMRDEQTLKIDEQLITCTKIASVPHPTQLKLDISGNHQGGCTTSGSNGIYEDFEQVDTLLDIYKLSRDGQEEPIYQIVPTFPSGVTPLFEIALPTVLSIKHIIRDYEIRVDDQHPLIVNCHGGKDRSALFAILFDLVTRFEEAHCSAEDFIDENIQDMITSMAHHVEHQSLEGAATTFWNNILKKNAKEDVRAELIKVLTDYQS